MMRSAVVLLTVAVGILTYTVTKQQETIESLAYVVVSHELTLKQMELHGARERREHEDQSKQLKLVAAATRMGWMQAHKFIRENVE